MDKKVKILFKRFLFTSSLIAATPLYLAYRIIGMMVGLHCAFPGISQLLSLFPGIFGILLRRGFYCMALKKCSSTSTIDFGTFLPSMEVAIGKHVYIGAHSIIAPSIIEEDVIIGSGVHVVNKDTHHFGTLEKPIREQGGDWRPIRIGRDSWIGNGAIIMADLADQCVVGAGSVVTRTVERGSVVAGNPAKVIFKRK